MAKVPKSIKLESTTLEVIDALLKKSENLKLKTKFNPMIEHLIETNHEFMEMKKSIEKYFIKANKLHKKARKRGLRTCE